MRRLIAISYNHLVVAVDCVNLTPYPNQPYAKCTICTIHFKTLSQKNILYKCLKNIWYNCDIYAFSLLTKHCNL